MVNVAKVGEALSRLTLMKFFPADDSARSALLEMVCGMIDNEEQAEWLARRMVQCYREWPGHYELRACFCNKYKPKDGVNAYSEVYPDGDFPPDPTAPRRIAAPEPKALPRGEPVTADAELQARIEKAAKEHSMPPAKPLATEFARMLREIETPPHLRQGPERPVNLDFKPITAEDVERERAKLRKERV